MNLALLALACTGGPPVDSPGEAPDTAPLGAPTATFPSFYGEAPTNLLMVSIDTLRRDALVRHGGAGHAAFLDEKAESGVALDRHTSCSSWTFPSVMCVVQGMTNREGGYITDLRSPGAAQMPETTPTLAGRLSGAGYRTMLVTTSSWFSADHNADVGFDSSEKVLDARTTAVFERGLERLEQARDAGQEPWYLHLHVREPHPMYTPPEAYLAGLEGLPELPFDVTDTTYANGELWPDMTEEERATLESVLRVRYDGEVRWMSDQLTEQFAALAEAGMLDDTLVVFWSDHGEQFWEHGEQTHGYGLHAEENDAVAIVWASNIVPARWDEPTSHIDLAPTVLALLGVDAAPEMTGVALGEAAPDRPQHGLVAGRRGVVQTVAQEGWKLGYHWETGARWLYDTTADPAERDDRYDPDDPRAVALSALLADETAALAPLLPDHTPR